MQSPPGLPNQAGLSLVTSSYELHVLQLLTALFIDDGCPLALTIAACALVECTAHRFTLTQLDLLRLAHPLVPLTHLAEYLSRFCRWSFTRFDTASILTAPQIDIGTIPHQQPNAAWLF